MSDMSNDLRERNDLLETLAMHRSLLRRTADGLTDEQARLTPTVSALSIGGIPPTVHMEQHSRSVKVIADAVGKTGHIARCFPVIGGIRPARSAGANGRSAVDLSHSGMKLHRLLFVGRAGGRDHI